MARVRGQSVPSGGREAVEGCGRAMDHRRRMVCRQGEAHSSKEKGRSVLNTQCGNSGGARPSARAGPSSRAAVRSMDRAQRKASAAVG
jgi:hypothetical protein